MSTAPGADLATTFRRLICLHGPMPVSRYMGESNARYYATRDPLGSTGDFTTAPEISQMFGEMAGLWLADLWLRAGRPADPIYVELGPGRGTLARDALRAMASHGLRPDVHLVEGSPTLRTKQADLLSGARFHDTIDTLPEDRPLLLIANEFLDALPIRQLVKTENGWRERMIGLEGDEFVFVAGSSPMDDIIPHEFARSERGTVIETCPAAAALVDALAARIERQGGGALFFDYGHLAMRTGSTLQAVRAHEKTDAFAAPGEMDLTAHVDFATLQQIVHQTGAVGACATQGDWLTAMGIGLRAQALARIAPDGGEAVRVAHDRLVHPDAMGELFKCMAITAHDWPAGSGFPALPAEQGSDS